MGRALFSQSYQSAPAVRTEPDLPPSPYEKWSRWNNFDPDSDEFFVDAEYEAFVDPSRFHEEQDGNAMLPDLLDGESSSSSSSEGSDRDRSSPMAVGSDDPASLIQDAYGSELDSRISPSWNYSYEFPRGNDNIQLPSLPAAPTVLPSSSIRGSTVTSDFDVEVSSPPLTPLSRRPTNITPLSIPTEPSMPSLNSPSPESPSTPSPDYPATPRLGTIATPSPIPTVSPHIYHWSRIPAPMSPTPIRESTGPLTNPNARMSRARITPVRVRVHSFAV